MSVNFTSEEIFLKEIICSKYGQTKAESDLIVPDLKPDIAKILQVCAKGVITQKTSQQDKAYIQGIVYVTVVYIPEEGGIKSIFTELDFSHIIDAKGAEAGNHIWAEAEVESIDYSIVNSRKINLKMTVGMDIKISRASICKLPTGFDKDSNVQAKHTDYSLCLSSLEEDRDFPVREVLEVPSGKMDIWEIIKLSAKAVNCTPRLDNGKIHLSGDLSVSALYTTEDGSLCLLEETLPINETLDDITLPEGDCDGAFTVKETAFELKENPEGGCRAIELSLVMGCTFKTVRRVNISAVCDAFGTTTPLKLIRHTYEIESLMDKSAVQIAHKETVSVPDYLPEVYKAVDLCGEARVTGISIENGRINVDGEILSNIIYLSSAEDAPVSGFCHITSFSQSVDMPCADLDSICEAKVDLDHISYSIRDDKSLELRFIVALTLTVLKGDSLKLIEDIEADDSFVPEPLSPVVIYFPKENEKVWDVAKHYMIAPEEIMKSNNLDSEELLKGQKICIFRM